MLGGALSGFAIWHCLFSDGAARALRMLDSSLGQEAGLLCRILLYAFLLLGLHFEVPSVGRISFVYVCVAYQLNQPRCAD